MPIPSTGIVLSALPTATTLDGTETMPLVQGGVTKKVAGPMTVAGAQTITGVKTFDADALFKSGRPWVDVRAFGTNGAAFQSAFDALPAAGGIIFVPPGTDYTIETTRTWNTKCVWIMGAGSGQSGTTGTKITVAAGQGGFILQNGAGSLGARSRISGIHLVGQDAGAGSNDGIRLQTSEGAVIDCMIEGFAGYGLHVLSSTGAADATINANVFRVDHVRCYNNKTGGMRTRGTDSNAGTITNLDVDTNGGFGLVEESSLGNHYFGVHGAGNTTGFIRIGVGGRNRMYGVYYEEENKPALQIDAGSSGSNVVEFSNCSRPDGANPIADNSGAVNFVMLQQGGLHWDRMVWRRNTSGGPYVDFDGPAGLFGYYAGATCRFQDSTASTNWTVQAQPTSLELQITSAQGKPVNLTDVGLKVGKALAHKRVNLAAGAGALTIDVSAGDIFRVELGGNVTDVTASNPTDGQIIYLEMLQDATGSRTATWVSSWKWAGAVAPTLTTTANRRDIFTFRYGSDTGFWHEISRSMNVG